jgi:UDP-glucose 4-epimerase
MEQGLKNMVESFRGKKILITGGLGFMGSNLAIKLVDLEAEVTILDNMLPMQGGNLFNIKPIKNDVTVDLADIRNRLLMNKHVQNKDYIFHLAGQVNHIDSMKNPLKDLDINCRGTLVLLEACRKYNRDVKIIFTGTRGQYGPCVKLPVKEDHPTNPKGLYAITNLTAEKMVLVYNDTYCIKGLCTRITNTYGPRNQMLNDQYGVFNWFIKKALDNSVIDIFGDGRIIRDYVFIDDTVNAMLMLALEDRSYGGIFNIGGGEPINFIDLAKKIIKIVGKGNLRYTKFTEERKRLEPGDYIADITKIKNLIKWKPKIGLDSGIKETIGYYKRFKKYYW